MTSKPKRILAAAGVVAGLALGGATIAGATGGGGDEREKGGEKPISGKALQKASSVALKHVGSGRVIDSEVRDQEGYYEVEVKRGDGRKFDVHLDRQFNVTDASPDGRGDRSDRKGG